MVRTEVASDLLALRTDVGGHGGPVPRVGGKRVDLFQQVLRAAVLKRIGQIAGHAFTSWRNRPDNSSDKST